MFKIINDLGLPEGGKIPILAAPSLDAYSSGTEKIRFLESRFHIFKIYVNCI